MSDASFINGNPEAMATFSAHTKAPAPPASLGRLLGEPAALAGTIEGILMAVLDKAATGVAGAYIANTSEDMTTISAKVKAAAAKYSATDLINSIDLATSTVKLADKGLGVVKQLSGGSGGGKTPGTDATGTTPGGGDQQASTPGTTSSGGSSANHPAQKSV
ncbi:hypothetical protein [Amycolatopsis sp. NPDC059021]|uniref:hypothetical protein n=1 Tax=Amycolatopsis sp. NPDC059021 TaxID=3346704 RepID=UPI00367131E1